MAMFPTESSYTLPMESTAYDLAQMSKVVEAAVARFKTAAEPEGQQPSPHDTLFHLHTSTIDLSLPTPNDTQRYARGRPQDDPMAKAFHKLRKLVTQEVRAVDLLPLAEPRTDLLRSTLILTGPHKNRGAAPHSLGVFLPTSHAARPLVWFRLPDSQAAVEWSSSSSSWDLHDWLQAAISLQPTTPTLRAHTFRDDKTRFHLVTALNMTWVPGPAPGAEELKIVLKVDVRADLETIFTPLPAIGHEVLGLVLHSLLPAPAPEADAYTRSGGLKRFYDCLRPAPDLPMSFHVGNLQPQGMTSQLYPFQKRTVALLLQRERSDMFAIDRQPAVVDPKGFWAAFDLGDNGNKTAFRRLTGMVTRVEHREASNSKGKGLDDAFYEDEDILGGWDGDLTLAERAQLHCLVDLSGVRGTMLCEEMGRSFQSSSQPTLTIRPRQDSRSYRSHASSLPPAVYTPSNPLHHHGQRRHQYRWQQLDTPPSIPRGSGHRPVQGCPGYGGSDDQSVGPSSARGIQSQENVG